MRKIEMLRQYDIRRLTSAGVVSPVVLRNMDIYDYHETVRTMRNPVALTAARFGVDTRTVSNALRDMNSPV